MRRPGALAGLLAGLVLLAGCSATGADEPVRGADQQGYVGSDGALTRVAPDKRAAVPALSGPQLGKDGATVSTGDYAGKVLVINVWGSWCAPCRAEAADLQAASVETKADAQFVGINTRDAAPAAPEAFVRAQGITYPSIFDPSGQTLLRLGGQVPPSAIPSTLVLDRQGRVAIRVLGTISKATLVDMVAEVAAGR
ncbi:TlpA family protein disulfide reductase [Microlunatus flavus]|uniref:Thiol-disulfide isomerase or thioredoxin n=1 Tax=Microlunatus flavus TaxID=1036181 RepID=A0A1H8Z531_9ACTN|nr:TlpA disulfide reductase family protein [Microlunatus flavus]SEP59441.1 Thiol-disulfide isomerase or thioredoxin [Microlunatus flavus]